MTAIKALLSVILYAISFFTVGISGEVKVSVAFEETPGGRPYIAFTYENKTNKPIFGPAKVKKIERKTDSGNVDVTDSLEIYNPEYAVRIDPMMYETRAGAYIKKQLDAGTYILTIEYDTTETFGNKGRITKTASTEFEIIKN